MKNKSRTVIIVLLVLAGLSLLLYPNASNLYNKQHQSTVIVAYTEALSAMDNELSQRLWAEAVAYNELLFRRQCGLVDPEETLPDYDSILSVTELGMMAYIDIPKLNCHLPIVHGTDDGALQSYIGHLETSSFPVGGPSTHCVLTGHRGLPSSRLFTDLDELAEGDIFEIQTLGVTLRYEVDQILTILPYETEALRIERDKDYCTLVTCTPYGVNSHRLLVRGHRVEIPDDEVSVTAPDDTVWVGSEPFYRMLLLVVLLVLLIILLALLKKQSGAKHRKKRR